MLEMSRGKDLKYSNQLPSWAKAVHAALLVFAALITLGFWALGIYMFMEEDGWILSIVLFLCGGVMAWLTWYIIRINTLYNNFIVITELREDGYYTSITNKKTSTVEESLIPFQQMKEILIGKTTRYVSGPSNSRGFYIVSAIMIIQWVDEKGAIQYEAFGEENQEGLDQWIQRFEAHQLQLYTTQHHIGSVTVSELQDGYAEIPKEPYDSSSASLKTGYPAPKASPEWKSTKMRAKEQEQQVRNDKKVFKPIYVGTMVANVLIAFLWMPVWSLDEENLFSESSPAILISFMNLFLLVFAGTYWRAKVKWYRPLLDTIVLIIVQLMGVYASELYRTSSSSIFLDAVVVEGIMSGFFLCGLFVMIRLVRRRKS